MDAKGIGGQQPIVPRVPSRWMPQIFGVIKNGHAVYFAFNFSTVIDPGGGFAPDAGAGFAIDAMSELGDEPTNMAL